MRAATPLAGLIAQHTRALKLPAVQRHYESLCRQAMHDGWSFEQFLEKALDSEIRSRDERAIARRISEARFPDIKTFDQMDYDLLRGISRAALAELATAEWISHKEDVVLAGPIGTGKTHIAIALGVEAARRRRRVIFTRAADLVRSLVEARDQRQLTRLQQRLQRADLLIIDELGFVPFERAGGELLFNVMATRYERRSTLVTTNLAFSEWVQVFGDEKLTTALLDRLTHHSHILTTKGPTCRTNARHAKAKEAHA